jgi:hypothetical protein
MSYPNGPIELKTFTMQLIDGAADGIRICRLTGSTLLTIVIPRGLLAQAKTLPDIPARGVYYLLDDHKGRLRRVYAGQTVQGIARLDSHNSRKDWWNKAVMHLAADSELSSDVVNGLESLAIDYIRNHGAYSVDNLATPKPYVSPYSESFINQLHEDILFRMDVLGYGLDAVGDDDMSEGLTFHTARRHVDGRGVYDATAGVFTVVAGSEVDLTHKPGAKNKPSAKMESMREERIANGTLVQSVDGRYCLTEPVDFSSPSSAAVFVLGGSQNGWKEWIAEDGRTLSDVYRKQAGDE